MRSRRQRCTPAYLEGCLHILDLRSPNLVLSMEPRPTTRWQAVLVCAAAFVAAATSMGLAAAAMLVPAPPAVVPLGATVCVVSPVFPSWELPGAIAALWTGPAARRGRAV